MYKKTFNDIPNLKSKSKELEIDLKCLRRRQLFHPNMVTPASKDLSTERKKESRHPAMLYYRKMASMENLLPFKISTYNPSTNQVGYPSGSRTKAVSSVEFCLRLKVSKLSKVICLHFFGHAHMMYHIKKDILGTWNLIHVNGKAPSCVDSWVKDLLVGIYNTNYQLIFTLTNWSKTKIV